MGTHRGVLDLLLDDGAAKTDLNQRVAALKLLAHLLRRERADLGDAVLLAEGKDLRNHFRTSLPHLRRATNLVCAERRIAAQLGHHLVGSALHSWTAESVISVTAAGAGVTAGADAVVVVELELDG